jgi:hypothetical protein
MLNVVVPDVRQRFAAVVIDVLLAVELPLRDLDLRQCLQARVDPVEATTGVPSLWELRNCDP